MKDGIGMMDKVSLTKERHESFRLEIIGQITRDRRERLPDGSSGRLLGSDTKHNTIYDKEKIVQLLDGRSGEHFSPGFVWLRLGSTQGAATRDLGLSVDDGEVTSVNANGTRWRWTWEDNSADNYGANWAQLYNGDPADAEGTEAGSGGGFPWFISETNPAFGAKPPSENWHYHYEIEIYSASTAIQKAGTFRLFQIIRGNTTDHLSASTTFLQPLTGAMAAVGSAITATSMTTPSDLEFRFVFNSADGQNNGTWANTRVTTDGPSLAAAILRLGGCTQALGSCGTKASGQAWAYTWGFSL